MGFSGHQTKRNLATFPGLRSREDEHGRTLFSQGRRRAHISPTAGARPRMCGACSSPPSLEDRLSSVTCGNGNCAVSEPHPADPAWPRYSTIHSLPTGFCLDTLPSPTSSTRTFPWSTGNESCAIYTGWRGVGRLSVWHDLYNFVGGNVTSFRSWLRQATARRAVLPGLIQGSRNLNSFVAKRRPNLYRNEC